MIDEKHYYVSMRDERESIVFWSCRDYESDRVCEWGMVVFIGQGIGWQLLFVWVGHRKPHLFWILLGFVEKMAEGYYYTFEF